MTNVSGAEALLLEILGIRFLTYLLNVDEGILDKRLQDGKALPPQQEAVLAELVAFLGKIPRTHQTDRLSLAAALAELARFRPDVNMGWSTAARVAAGGDVDVPKGKDGLDRALVDMARDVYPLFLIPPQAELQFHTMRGPATTAVVLAHPQHTTFENAVLADDVLSQLFPDEDKHTGRSGMVYKSTGSGGGMQLSMFADTLLRSAWEYAAYRDPHPSPMAFAKEALGFLPFTRKAVKGERLKIPAMIGVTGIRVPAGTQLDLPWGRLREVTEHDQRLIPPSLSGQVSHTAADGSHVTVDYAGDLVMELDVPYKITIGEIDTQAWAKQLHTAHDVEQKLETLRLALLLGTSRRPTPIALGTWRYFLDPLAQGFGMSWADPRQMPMFNPAALSGAEAKSWKDWTERVDNGRVKSIDIAVRRTLRATAERADPTDALIDAVIAWENLVGSQKGEPTLRVSAALAWLLGADAKERKKLKKVIGELYSIRSGVVHGTRNLDPKEAGERREEALDITIRSLQILFRDRHDLLTECKDGGERSNRLILGG